MNAIASITLANDVTMPLIGFGVYQVPADDCEGVVSAPLSAGYRSIDTAAGYANEQGVGRALAASGLPRDEVFVTTKLWVQDGPTQTTARVALEKSLERLGLDHIDLYLIHQPFGDYYGSWRAMEAAYDEGLVRAIGVSNFYPDRLVDLIDHNRIAPMVNQVETHPFFQRVDDQRLMAELGVRIESWGPFAEGRHQLFTDPVLSAIGESHNKTVGQVVLRWLLQREVIAIPKTVRPERMAENLDITDFSLSEEEMALIATLDRGESAFFDHRDPEWVRRLGRARVD